MTGRTRTEALHNTLDPIQKALNYITVGRLALVRGGLPVSDSMVEAVALNRGAPVPLRSNILGSLSLQIGFWIQIVQFPENRSLYEAKVARYLFAFSDGDDREFLGFHWNPFALGQERTFPHLHVGQVASGRGNVLPDRFHKLHIPTGVVTAQAIVRFAIEELGVQTRAGIGRDTALRQLMDSDEFE